ncbi:glycosyl hydrolase family 28 [Fontibacillus phaseoli]|uniref:Glycosyl hydrolase family 28 n=1 Tax=Fontibacillus phaseoli TaxID=1416533 RepID=A0A369BPG0_9BACL|nr:glycosyl hydrolase family 28 protein [Fontibacillus phaseoli]RCX21554.1 glycosyl hydrolase family 28 [Fontibacillus phaseoli]
MNQLIIYGAPKDAVRNDDFAVYVREPGKAWQELFVYEAKVDMHDVRSASMAYFDMEGEMEVRIESRKQPVHRVDIRPLSYHVKFSYDEYAVKFTLNQPRKLSIEINGDRFTNLHLFANPCEQDAPLPEDNGIQLIRPGIHRTEDLLGLLERPNGSTERKTLYFAPGMHYIEETVLRIPSHTTVYIAGGAIVVGSLVCDHVQDVVIRGRGILYLSDFHRFSAFRGVRIIFSRNIDVEGITVLDPPHYSIYLGKSEQVRIRNFKSFSTRGWSDGIDMMACTDIEIDDVFLRTSDDCIAIYGSRWDYRGDSGRIRVRNAVLWADVAHPLMMGTHGDHCGNGNTLYDVRFEDIDILEHHEPQVNYMGAMAINAGDKNTIRDISYKNIRVEDFELGRLIDVRVMQNRDYNPAPGNRIENITFEDIRYQGTCSNPSRIFGYDAERTVSGVRFTRLRINDRLILQPEEGLLELNDFSNQITFDI